MKALKQQMLNQLLNEKKALGGELASFGDELSPIEQLQRNIKSLVDVLKIQKENSDLLINVLLQQHFLESIFDTLVDDFFRDTNVEAKND